MAVVGVESKDAKTLRFLKRRMKAGLLLTRTQAAMLQILEEGRPPPRAVCAEALAKAPLAPRVVQLAGVKKTRATELPYKRDIPHRRGGTNLEHLFVEDQAKADAKHEIGVLWLEKFSNSRPLPPRSRAGKNKETTTVDQETQKINALTPPVAT